MNVIIPKQDLLKAFVRQHTRKGKNVGPYFTKRPPGKVSEKHTKERFYDHSKETASKAHEELESKKAHHESVLDALKKHHEELVKKGPSKDEKGLSHADKIKHLKAEMKNQNQHIENHSRKQGHIKNRYKIAGKQHERKRSKSDLEKKIDGHSDKQKETIRKIHAEHEKTDTHDTGRVLSGKDKDHVYLERRNKETGETHHVAIHKDGDIKDPNVLHEGKFDHKTLTDKQAQEDKKKVVVKKEDIKPKKKEPVPEKPKRETKKSVAKKPIDKPKKEPVILSKKVKTKKYGEITRKDHIEKLIGSGGGIEIFKAKDSAKANKASKAYANWLSGDKIDNAEGERLKKEHEKWHEKDEYRLTEGKDIYYKVSKAEYDYAKSLLEKKKLEPKKKPQRTVKKEDKKQNLTANEKSYLSWYSGDGFKELNEYLRKDPDKKDKTLEKYADGLNSAISKNSLDENKTLYRGINVNEITKAIQNLKPGNKIEVSSFQSTTENPESVSSYSGLTGVVLKINAPKGTNAIDMNKAGESRNPAEQEYLLPNKGHYVVRGMNKPKEGAVGRTVVAVDYVPESGDLKKSLKTKTDLASALNQEVEQIQQERENQEQEELAKSLAKQKSIKEKRKRRKKRKSKK